MLDVYFYDWNSNLYRIPESGEQMAGRFKESAKIVKEAIRIMMEARVVSEEALQRRITI